LAEEAVSREPVSRPDFRVLRENTAIFAVLPANIGFQTRKTAAFLRRRARVSESETGNCFVRYRQPGTLDQGNAPPD
jgi:hypothetical protein